MFTGLISDVGEVVELGEVAAGRRFTIACSYDAASIPVGASIACDGACMTVTDVRAKEGRTLFAIDVSPESLARTTLGEWREGRRINLERSLKLGDELGGHLVTGHVDALAVIEDIRSEGEFRRFTFRVPEELARFIAPKGSVALNGTSLTVNEVEGTRFGVQMIPHTLKATNWHLARAGARVNLEVDLMARYAARLLQVRNGTQTRKENEST